MRDPIGGSGRNNTRAVGMRRRGRCVGALVGAASIALSGGSALAERGDLTTFNTRYGTADSRLDSCSTCHTSPPSLNSYGAAYDSAGRNSTALQTIEGQDSDGDGASNLAEIQALFFPGNANDSPPMSTPTAIRTATPPPTVTPTPTPTRTPGAPATVTATRPPSGCGGDCDGDARLTIVELVRAVAISLNPTLLDDCTAADADHDGAVSIDELIGAVEHALKGCGIP